MGGAVSELRGAIHTHVVIAQHYPRLLEPCLAAVQFFLRTAESGEGADRDRPLDDVSTDVIMTNHRLFEEASTEVELLVENPLVMRVLLDAVANYAVLQLAPPNDPFKQWYDPPWRVGKKPMPKYVEVPEDQVPRFRVAVMRCSIRCLRLMMFCTDGRALLEQLKGPQVLDQAARENPLDDYVKNDVKAIFKAVYGGDNAVRRIAMGDLPIIVEMLVENRESAIVQLAGVERICGMLANVNALLYTPSEPSADAEPATTVADNQQPQQQSQQRKLFEELETLGVVPLLTEALKRFDVDRYLRLYLNVCRFIAYVATDERNAKLIGQCGGIEGAIRLLFKAREMQRDKRFMEKEEDAKRARLEAQKAAHHDWSAIVDTDKNSSTPAAPPPPTVLEGGAQRVATIDALAVVDFTPTEIGQQAMWALDLLATVEFNVAQMKRHRLKYLLEEIRLDPDHHALGAALIVTRRLRLIRWDKIIGLPEDDVNVEAVISKKETRREKMKTKNL